jgi:hypothetical protein
VAAKQLVGARIAIKELFQSAAGQVLLEYLLARADLLKDEFFEKSGDVEVLKAHLQELDEIVGIVAFMDSFKELKPKGDSNA